MNLSLQEIKRVPSLRTFFCSFSSNVNKGTLSDFNNTPLILTNRLTEPSFLSFCEIFSYSVKFLRTLCITTTLLVFLHNYNIQASFIRVLFFPKCLSFLFSFLFFSSTTKSKTFNRRHYEFYDKNRSVFLFYLRNAL